MVITDLDAPARPGLAEVVRAVRDAVRRSGDWAVTALDVAAAVQDVLPGPQIMTADELAGDASTYRTHTLHVEPDGAFSVVGLVWRPGQRTRIHDHVTWCVFGVLAGVEHEELFDESLRPVGTNDNLVGEVTGFAPPGDIHRVHNSGTETAVSLHVYGTDITRIGSSVRRYYD